MKVRKRRTYTASRKSGDCGGRKSNLDDNQMAGDRLNKIQKSGMYALHRNGERNSRPRNFVLTNNLDLISHLIEFNSDAD